MEHKKTHLEEHCEKLKELVSHGEFGAVNEDKFDELMETTPCINKVWAGDAVLDTLFATAEEKMKDDEDKQVLEKLKALVKRYEHEMKDPCSVHQKALFFPNEK
mmetsp:Transcript_23999/g.27661  ORF Transcript_23999/g.27661 Transcript_23999/m.27661 type:complete len:104 (-) Transcript_23999:475-786(-)